MFKKKGIFLIYVLVTAVLISIFLIGAVENMHNSFFLTNKFTGENKAYWAAESGLQFCEYKLKSDLSWPFNTKTSSEGTEKFGKFTITTKYENENNGYSVYGTSEDGEEEFCIYFSNNPSKKTNDLIADLVPSAFPNEPKNLAYCSYNSIDKKQLESIYQKKKLEYSQVSFKVSKSPEYIAVITTPGIYVVSDGRCRGYRTILEKMLIADNSNTIGGGIYCGGDLNIGITGSNNRFKVNQISNSRAEIYCKQDVNISRNNDWINAPLQFTNPTNLKYLFPFFIGDGTLYLNNAPYKFELAEAIHNGKNHGIERISNYGNTNKENETFKQKYGLNIEPYKNSFDSTFPKISSHDIQQMKASESPTPIDAGTYCAIKSEDDNGTYIFCYLPINFLDDDYQLNENLLNKAMKTGSNIDTESKTAIKNSKDIIDSIIINRNQYKFGSPMYKSLSGQLSDAKDDLENTLQDLQDKYATSGSRIEQFVKENGGYVICGELKMKKRGEWQSNPDKRTNPNFSIKTVNINTITTITEKEKNKTENTENTENENPELQIGYDTTETPIITIKKSVSVKDTPDLKGFTLLTLTLESNPLDIDIGGIIDAVENDENFDSLIPKPEFTYSISHDISTDLIFDKKNTGLNEAYILREINKNNRNTNSSIVAANEQDTGTDMVQSNNLIACQTVNLYSEGPVILYGKLSGTGQILSEKSVFFKAGTQLNTSNYIKKAHGEYTEKKNVGETSKLGVYAGKTIKMGSPDGETYENILELHNKIKYLLAGEKGKSIKEIANKVLYQKNEDKEITVTKDDLGRFATERSSNSEIKDNDLSELSASIAEDWKKPILLSKLMSKYYGFESREAEDYIQEILERNCTYDEKTKEYKMTEKENEINIMLRSSSSFSGVLYACGGFKCDAEGNNIVINGAIVTYGADPTSYSPGSGGGLGSLSDKDMLNISKFGNIEIYNCRDFSIVYDSSDLAAFVNKISDKPINLSGIYSNKL